MSLEQTERDKLVSINQKLDDHIAQQCVDMNDIKTTMVRVETKLDVVTQGKADKAEIDRLAQVTSSKANTEDIKEIGKQVNKIQNNQINFLAGIVIALLAAIISLVVALFKSHL